MNFARCPMCNKICGKLKELDTTRYFLVDGKAKKRKFKTYQFKCVNHKYFTTDKNGNVIGSRVKYDYDVIEYIIKLYKGGRNFRDISNMVGVSCRTVGRVLKRKSIKVNNPRRTIRKIETNEINLEVAEYDKHN